jgi:hypothetical protein
MKSEDAQCLIDRLAELEAAYQKAMREMIDARNALNSKSGVAAGIAKRIKALREALNIGESEPAENDGETSIDVTLEKISRRRNKLQYKIREMLKEQSDIDITFRVLERLPLSQETSE